MSCSCKSTTLPTDPLHYTANNGRTKHMSLAVARDHCYGMTASTQDLSCNCLSASTGNGKNGTCGRRLLEVSALGWLQRLQEAPQAALVLIHLCMLRRQVQGILLPIQDLQCRMGMKRG